MPETPLSLSLSLYICVRYIYLSILRFRRGNRTVRSAQLLRETLSHVDLEKNYVGIKILKLIKY